MQIKFGMLINATADFQGIEVTLDNEVVINVTVKGKPATITLSAKEAQELSLALQTADVAGLALCEM